MTNYPSILVDVVQTVSVHNGVARVVIARLDDKGNPQTVLEVCVPTSQAAAFARAFESVRK